MSATARECWERINALIVRGPLPGNGCDQSAQRNGLVLATNVIFDLAFPKVEDVDAAELAEAIEFLEYIEEFHPDFAYADKHVPVLMRALKQVADVAATLQVRGPSSAGATTPPLPIRGREGK